MFTPRFVPRVRLVAIVLLLVIVAIATIAFFIPPTNQPLICAEEDGVRVTKSYPNQGACGQPGEYKANVPPEEARSILTAFAQEHGLKVKGQSPTNFFGDWTIAFLGYQ